MITYKIVSVRPKQMFMQVRYRKAGMPDFFKNFNPSDFSEANLHTLAAEGSTHANKFWAEADALPETVTLTRVSGQAKPEVWTNEYPSVVDLATERVEVVTTETAEAIEHTYTKRPLTAEEQAADLADFRATFQISMRQCQRALLAAGLLDDVATAIASMPEPDRSVAQIEWDSASVVDRSSPLVTALGPALGMTEAQLDDMFRYAKTL